jgi:hypothetical protein
MWTSTSGGGDDDVLRKEMKRIAITISIRLKAKGTGKRRWQEKKKEDRVRKDLLPDWEH